MPHRLLFLLPLLLAFPASGLPEETPTIAPRAHEHARGREDQRHALRGRRHREPVAHHAAGVRARTRPAAHLSLRVEQPPRGAAHGVRPVDGSAVEPRRRAARDLGQRHRLPRERSRPVRHVPVRALRERERDRPPALASASLRGRRRRRRLHRRQRHERRDRVRHPARRPRPEPDPDRRRRTLRRQWRAHAQWRRPDVLRRRLRRDGLRRDDPDPRRPERRRHQCERRGLRCLPRAPDRRAVRGRDRWHDGRLGGAVHVDGERQAARALGGHTQPVRARHRRSGRRLVHEQLPPREQHDLRPQHRRRDGRGRRLRGIVERRRARPDVPGDAARRLRLPQRQLAGERVGARRGLLRGRRRPDPARAHRRLRQPRPRRRGRTRHGLDRPRLGRAARAREPDRLRPLLCTDRPRILAGELAARLRRARLRRAMERPVRDHRRTRLSRRRDGRHVDGHHRAGRHGIQRPHRRRRRPRTVTCSSSATSEASGGSPTPPPFPCSRRARSGSRSRSSLLAPSHCVDDVRRAILPEPRSPERECLRPRTSSRSGSRSSSTIYGSSATE